MSLTTEQAMSLSKDEYEKLTFDEQLEAFGLCRELAFIHETSQRGSELIDTIDATELINDHKAKQTKVDVILGHLLIFNRLMIDCAEQQLEAEDGSTDGGDNEFAVQLLQAVAGRAEQCLQFTEQMLTMFARYQSVLEVRREFNQNVIDSSWTAVPIFHRRNHKAEECLTNLLEKMETAIEDESSKKSSN